MRRPFSRYIMVLFAVLAISSCASTKESVTDPDLPPLEQSDRGHVAFFFLAGMEYKNTREAYGEFIYGYEGAKRALLSEGYTYSYHSALPMEVENGDLRLTLSKKNLSEGAGLVLIKNKNRFRIVYGIYSGPDILRMSREYFQRRP